MRTRTWIATAVMLAASPATAGLAAGAPQRGGAPDPARDAVTPPVDGTEILVSARGRSGAEARFEIVAFLPAARPAWIAAERALVRIERELGEQVAIVALVPERGAGLVEVRNRGDALRCARLLDVGDRNRERFAAWLGDDAGAVFVLRDRDRRPLSYGRLDGGVRHDVVDALAGRLPVAAGDATPRIANRATATATALPSLDEVRHEPWLAALATIDRGELRAGLRAALRALRERPEFQARVLEAVARRDADALGGEFGRRALTAIQVDEPRCEIVQRAAFVGFAALGDGRRAHGAAFAWLESAKGVPGRALEVLAAVDAATGGAAQYATVVDRAIELGLLASPGDEALLRRGLAHAVTIRDDAVLARRHGLALVVSLAGDSQALNSLAWRLLTDAPYAGRFRDVALAAARAMQDCPDWQTYWRIDTLALACHEAGLHAEAVRWQREAVDGCDPAARHRYAARLERYEDALAASR